MNPNDPRYKKKIEKFQEGFTGMTREEREEAKRKREELFKRLKSIFGSKESSNG